MMVAVGFSPRTAGNTGLRRVATIESALVWAINRSGVAPRRRSISRPTRGLKPTDYYHVVAPRRGGVAQSRVAERQLNATVPDDRSAVVSRSARPERMLCSSVGLRLERGGRHFIHGFHQREFELLRKRASALRRSSSFIRSRIILMPARLTPQTVRRYWIRRKARMPSSLK